MIYLERIVCSFISCLDSLVIVYCDEFLIVWISTKILCILQMEHGFYYTRSIKQNNLYAFATIQAK